tara:strand:+ start:2957 stop:3469 length:513 start_codon:yes stop_codon:yes gene_type:complete
MKLHRHYLAGILLTTTASLAQGVPAHQHGVATLQAVLSSTTLHIELRSPLMNLVGFEGHADTPEQQQALDDVRQRFAQDVIQSRPCQLQHTSIELPEQSHDHDHDHDHDEHTDLTVSWEFYCPAAGSVTLDSRLITTFPGIETLQLLWITDQQQGADTFDHDQPILLPRR